jgi:hypothetical protein
VAYATHENKKDAGAKILTTRGVVDGQSSAEGRPKVGQRSATSVVAKAQWSEVV